MSERNPVGRLCLWSWIGGWAAAHTGLLLTLVIFQWDERLSGRLCSWANSGSSVRLLLWTLTSWGNPLPTSLLAIGSVCFALILRNVTAAAVLLVVPYVASFSCNLIKEWVERDRPVLECVSIQADGFSFPSGHAVGVTTGFLLAALYLSNHTPRAVSTVIVLLAGLVAELISWSRVLLGVHFSVDVLSGQLLGVGWLAIGALLLRGQATCRSRRRTRRGALAPQMSPCHDDTVPFNHNDHYHDRLLRELPSPCRKALDVGCGHGRFAQKLALREIEVDAIDTDADVIAAARNQASIVKLPGIIHFEREDITRVELPPKTYDYISCLASIHHVPIETVEKLRESLTTNGVLVILGCYRESTLWDCVASVLAVPVNALYRMAVFFQEKRSNFRTASTREVPLAPVASPSMSLTEIRNYVAAPLPKCRIQRLLFWRYLLVFHNNQEVTKR